MQYYGFTFGLMERNLVLTNRKRLGIRHDYPDLENIHNHQAVSICL